MEWKEKKMKERRQAQKRLQKKAKKDMEDEKKKLEKHSDSAKTFQSWQVDCKNMKTNCIIWDKVLTLNEVILR